MTSQEAERVPGYWNDVVNFCLVCLVPFPSLFLDDKVENIDVTPQQSILGLYADFCRCLFVCVCMCMHACVCELLQVTVSCQAVLHVFREATITVQMCSPPLSL